MDKEIYNNFYKKYGENIHRDDERFYVIANLCKGEVLDVGCGTGDLADFYNGYYAGVDISDVAIKMAIKKRRKNANFFVGDISTIKETGINKFDTIVMAEFLEHLKDDKAVFESLKQWLKPDSRIIISVPNGDRVPDPNHHREFTVPQLRKRFSALGKVKFYRWSGFEKRILMTIDLDQKNKNLISLVEIVKDEGMGLEESILSCIEFIDNIVISVDYWSTDESEEIAKRYADVLKHHEWKDDFAIARNFAAEGVKTKWILVMDGHEYVKKYKNIDKMLELDIDGLFVKVEMDSHTTFYTNRIHRSHLKWKHAIHNAVSTKISKMFKDFTIKHDRIKKQSKKAMKERWDQRFEMMPRLLKAEIKKDRKSIRPLFYLGRWYLSGGQLKKAIKYYRKYLKRKGPKGERWYVCWEASVAANKLRKPLLALKYLRKAEQEVPNRWETAKHIGITYMLFGRWPKAIEFLVDSFKINTGDFAFMPEKKNKAETWDMIGFCWFQLKQYNKAKISWEEAIKTDKNKSRIKLNKRRIELIDRGINF